MVTRNNNEYFALSRYLVGQLYKIHCDKNPKYRRERYVIFSVTSGWREGARDVLQRRVMMPIEGLIALPFSGESTGCALHHREKAK